MRRLIQLLIVMLTGLGTVGPAAAFRSPEHKRIGDEAARYVFPSFRRTLRLPIKDRTGRVLVTRDGKIWTGRGAAGRYLTLGDLIALYGDFRKSVGELLSTSAQRLAYLAKVVRDGTRKHPGLIFKETSTALKLFVNQSHFSSVAVRTYVENHRRALGLAAEGARSGDASKLWLALHHEGLGFHSLTDIFAPGHALIDRRKWVRDILTGKERAKGLLKNPLCGMAGLFRVARGAFGALLNKLAHDQFNKNGAFVKNLSGQSWLAYGDHGYGKQSRAAQLMPVRAVSASLQEVIGAYLRLRRIASNPAAFEKMRGQLLRPAKSLRALLYIPAQFRNASYTPPFGRKKKLCAGNRFCDLLQRRAAEHYLGRIKAPVAMATAVNDCEDLKGKIQGFWAKVVKGPCYEACRPGYTGGGPLCYEACPKGFPDHGAFCGKPASYSVGGGFGWRPGDPPFNYSYARRRCERRFGRCHRKGLIWYPLCRKGFHKAGGIFCSANCPRGMRDIGVSCQKRTHRRGLVAASRCRTASKRKSATAGRGIRVVSGTYGGNCGKAAGNVTAHLARSCNGQTTCAYRVNYQIIGDTAPGCAKTYDAAWRCGGGPVRQASLPPEAHGRVVTLQCEGGAQAPVATAARRAAAARAAAARAAAARAAAARRATAARAAAARAARAAAARAAAARAAAARASAGVLRAGRYRLECKHGGGQFVTQVGAGYGNGANVVRERAKGWNTQLWKIYAAPGVPGFYRIEIYHGGNRFLTQVGAGYGNGANVVVERWKGWNTQLWKLHPVGGGFYKIEIRHGGNRFLTAVGGGYASGTNIAVERWKGWNTQLWRITR